MSVSYSGDPTTSPKDAVRFLLGDTDDTVPVNAQFQDEEINYLLVNWPDPNQAAIRGCLQLATRYAKLVTKSVGDLRLQYGDRAKEYRALAAELRSRTVVPMPWAAGISITDKLAVELDIDRVPNNFRLGQDDFNGPPSRRDDPRWSTGGAAGMNS